MIPSRPTRAEISIPALNHNFTLVKKLAGNSQIIAIVKAEAYGHGLIPISREFATLGADMLGVSFLEEGVALRDAGINIPILVMGGLVDEQIERYLDYDLILTVSSIWKARHVEQVAASRRIKAEVHLKIDTGIGRIGQQWHSVGQFFSEIVKLKHLNVTGIYSHFAASDEEDLELARIQIERFASVIDQAQKSGIDNPLIHFANSGAVMQLDPAWRNIIPDQFRTAIRPGILLYGYAPSPNLENRLDLKPVMTVKTRAVYVKKPVSGSTIGYGVTYRASGNKWIATLPIGYGDGYPRALSNRGWVMMRKRRCPIVGRVSMDMITVECDEAYLGDEAIILGGNNDEQVSLWEVSKLLNTIPYELICQLTARVPRIYIE